MLAVVAAGLLLVIALAGCKGLSSALSAGPTAKAHAAVKTKQSHAKKSHAK